MRANEVEDKEHYQTEQHDELARFPKLFIPSH